MISFFRKIRQKLLSQNRVTRYLGYAVGEILLVVIGILVAQKVNNWNVDRQSKKQQTDFLVDTLNELEKDQRQLEEIIKFQELKELKSLELIALLEKPIPDKKDQIDFLFSYLSSSNATFFPNVGVFENALSAGKIDLIKNDDLKYTIMDLYMRSYKRLVFNGEIYDERYDLVSQERKKYFNKIKQSINSWEQVISQEFYSHVEFLYIQNEIYTRLAKTSLQEIQKVIQAIEAEIA